MNPRKLFCWVWAGLIVGWPLFSQELELSGPKLTQLKKQPCVFLHAWATWCTICIEELPQILNTLEKQKKINPIIVDISSPMAQNQFSKKWSKILKPSFPMYFKPPGNDAAYRKALTNEKWDGSLPYSAIFHRSKRLWSSVGSIAKTNIFNIFPAECK